MTKAVNVASLGGAMTADASGNVGIGTSSPTSIAGYSSLTVNGTTSGLISVKYNGTDGGYIYTDSSSFNIDSKAATPNLVFKSNGSEKMRIDSSGNVGIGTSSPVNKVEVSGSVTLRQTYQTYLVNSYYDGAWKYAENGMAWGIGNNFGGPTNGMCIATAAVNASGSGAALTWSPRLGIDSSGNLQFNSGYGSVATAYGCRAWVNFNGTGTVAINGSGNVSSITDNGTGDYTVNFSTAMPDAVYNVAQSCAQTMGGTAGNDNNANFQPHTYSSGSIRGWTSYTDVRVDCVSVNVTVHR